VVDFDPLQADLEYSIVSGSLPVGMNIDPTNGELYGALPQQAAVEIKYNFTVRASRSPIAGVVVYTDKDFYMTVIGNINIGIRFITDSNLGTIIPGIPSLFSVEAEAAEANRFLTYSITEGSLPAGLTLSTQGNIMGSVSLKEFTTLDENDVTFDDNTLSLDREYTFTIGVSDQYQSLATSKEFKLTVKLPYAKEYGNMTAVDLLGISDRESFYSIAQDPNINNNDYIFRSEDPKFGVRNNAEMLLIAGLEYQTLTTLQQAMEQNHEPKILYFGDIKTAVAKENGTTKYEVVYLEMRDNLVNNSGNVISKSINLSANINRPLLGPAADASRITADIDFDRGTLIDPLTSQPYFEFTTDGGLSFSISGSKIRYASPMSADLGTFEKLFPNAVAHMRSVMKDLGQKEYVHLPLWMRTSQDGSGAPLGYKMAVVLAYCKPGKAGLVRKRILDKNIDFKKLLFKIERYLVNSSNVDTGTIMPDGSTRTFELNEIVHEEDIKIRENADVLTYGDQITADNNVDPSYLRADTLLRSVDYEPEFYLTHDVENKKTTINFTNAPETNVKIRVERLGDKYLAFRRKLKE